MTKTTHQLDLDTGVMLRLRHAVGSRISVARGCAWITQEGDRRDTVLTSGMNFVLESPGLVIVQMLKAGQVQVDFADGHRREQAPLIDALKPRIHRHAPAAAMPA